MIGFILSCLPGELPHDRPVSQRSSNLTRISFCPPFSRIGLHALELAKTCWNAFVTDAVARSTLKDMETYLALAERTFSVLLGSTAESTDNVAEPVSELMLLREMVTKELK